MKLGILKADDVNPSLAEQFGEYPQQVTHLLHRVDPSIVTTSYDVFRQQYPAELDEQDGYIITGSRFSVYDDEVWIARLEEFVRRLYVARKKLVGICFGHQLIAQALGGETRRAEVGWGIGVHHISLYESVSPLGQKNDGMSWLVSHRDQVVVPAKGGVVLAGSDFCPNAICQIGDNILSMQGHPEFVVGYARGLLRARRDIYGADVYDNAINSLGEPTDELKLARWIVDFFATPASM